MSKPFLCSHTTYQAISNTLPWSEHLAPITSNLRLAFHTSIDRVDTVKLSNDALALYRELMDTSTDIPRFQMNSSITPVTDVIDTILTSVAQLRIIARRPSTEKAKESTAIALLHILGLVCSPNAVVMAGPLFLLPRSLHPNVLERLKCENYASLLVGVSVHTGAFVKKDALEKEMMCLDAKLHTIAENTALSVTFDTDYTPAGDSGYGRSKHTSNVSAEQSASPMEVDKFEETWNSPIDANSKASSDRHMTSSDTLSSTKLKKASTIPLDIPFDAHVLPGRGVRTNCFLPALCVANETNITALITSVAYQRHVLGISLPVVGICLYTARDSIFARVVIGWVDGMVESCRIPSVRIATAARIFTNSPSIGVFDLLDPCATILLAQFLLSLSFHVDALSSTQFAPGDHPISWRADQTILYSPSLNPCCMEFVKEWKDQMQSDPHEDTITNCSLYPVDIPESDVLCNTCSSAPSHMDDGQSSSLPDLSMKDIKGEETLRGSSSLSSSTSWKPTSCICEDLHSRGVIVLAAVHSNIRIKRLDGDLNAKERVRDGVYEILALYFSITSPPRWPNDWIEGTNTPCGDPVYEYLQNKLLQEIKVCPSTEQKRLSTWEKALPHPDFQTDDIIGFDLFANRVSLFFLSVASARSSLFEKTPLILEGDNRPGLDWVLRIACSRLGDTIDCRNWSEHPMALPTTCDKTVPDWCQLFALQSDIALDQGVFYARGKIAGSRGMLNYFGDACFHIDAFERAGASASPSCQNQDADHTSVVASILVTGDVDKGGGHVSRHFDSEGPSSGPKRTLDDSLTTLVVLHQQTSQTKEQVLDRCCLCMVSLLSSLKSVGLFGTTVFGIVTNQTECTLLTAMQDRETGYSLVVREATVCYDLTKPLDALRLFMTLHRIFRRQLELFAPLREEYIGGR